MSYILLWELVALRGQKSMKNAYKRIQAQKLTFFKIALNRVLTLPYDSTRRPLLISSGIIDLENKNISVVTKH